MISLYKTTYLKAEQKLAEDYQAKRHAAIQAQRNGKLGDYVCLSREAEAIAMQLEDATSAQRGDF